MKKLTVAGLGLILVLTGCGGNGTAEITTSVAPTTGATTTTTEVTTTTTESTTTTLSPGELAAIEFEADVKLIKQLWRGFSDSWFSSFEDGIQYVADHNYPSEGCTVDAYMELVFPGGPIEGFTQEFIVDSASIERDQGWIIRGGVLDGQLAEGRVYIFSMTSTISEPGYEPLVSTREVHTTVFEGTPYFFITCH